MALTDMDIVPGRLGLLVTLFLIFANVYNSVEGPTSRGFSFIEIWMLGMQMPILMGIFEYAALLAMKKYKKFDQMAAKKIDKWTFIGSTIYMVIFIILYWVAALTYRNIECYSNPLFYQKKGRMRLENSTLEADTT